MSTKKYFTEAERKAARSAQQTLRARGTEELRAATNARVWQRTRSTEELLAATNASARQRARGTPELRAATLARQKQNKRGTPERRLATNVRQRQWKKSRNGTRADLGRNLYVLKSATFPDIYKVGRSNNPARRARELEAGHFLRMQVILDDEGMGIHESEVHDALRAFQHNPENRRQTEWFKLPEEQLVAIVRDIVSRYEH